MTALHAGRYRALEILGEGAFGRVLRAEDERLGRTVALKLLVHLSDRDEVRQRFHREAQVTARLRHPHVIEVLDHGETEEGVPFIAYEFVEGTDLERRRRRGPPPDPATIARWAEAIARALAAAHAVGVVHRDLKPANILLRDGDHPLLADFGLAGIETPDETLTRTGQILGTPMFMAPEIWRGGVPNEATDQFSWAAIFYQLATGRHPYQDASGRVDSRQLASGAWRPPRLEFVPVLAPSLRAVLARALSLDPSERFPSMAALAEALERPEPTEVLDAEPAPLERPPPARRGLVVQAGLVALAALGFGWLSAESARLPPPPPAWPAPDDAGGAARGRLEAALDGLLRGHRDPAGKLIPVDDTHRLAMQGHLLDPVFPLHFGRALEAMDAWLGTQETEALEQEPSRGLLGRLRADLCGHLLSDLDGLERVVARRFEGAVLGSAEATRFLRNQHQQYLERQDACMKLVAAALPSLESRHLDPPLPLYLLLGDLVIAAVPGELTRYAVTTEDWIDERRDPGSLEGLVALRSHLLAALRDREDFGPVVQRILAQAPGRFPWLRAGKAALRLQYLDAGLRTWGRTLRLLTPEARPRELGSLDLHLDELEDLVAVAPDTVAAQLRRLSEDLAAFAGRPEEPAGARLARIERMRSAPPGGAPRVSAGP